MQDTCSTGGMMVNWVALLLPGGGWILSVAACETSWQGPWLVRPDPRLQIESTINWLPVQQVDPSSLACEFHNSLSARLGLTVTNQKSNLLFYLTLVVFLSILCLAFFVLVSDEPIQSDNVSKLKASIRFAPNFFPLHWLLLLQLD